MTLCLHESTAVYDSFACQYDAISPGPYSSYISFRQTDLSHFFTLFTDQVQSVSFSSGIELHVSFLVIILIWCNDEIEPGYPLVNLFPSVHLSFPPVAHWSAYYCDALFTFMHRITLHCCIVFLPPLATRPLDFTSHTQKGKESDTHAVF